jgi:serine/threonine protein kinase
VADLIDLGGGPVNRTEHELVQRLLKELPSGYSVIPNASLPDPRTGHAYEYDAIVVAPHAVYVVEMKGWRGTIRQLGQADWQLDGGRVERNPLPLADQKARVLASHLRDGNLGARPPYVQAVLVCGADETTYEIYGLDARRCLLPSTLAPTLRDPSRLNSRGEPGDHRAIHKKLVSAIVGTVEARATLGRRYGSYRTTTLIERDEERAVWLGEHALLQDGRLVRVRAWYLSAYRYTDEERRARLARLQRAAEALARVGDHPRVATLRDFGEHDGEFFEVTDWSEHGTLLTAFVRGALARTTEAQRLGILRDIAEALEAAHRQRVFHRALCPEAVLLDAAGRARLTGFDLAFVEGASGTVFGQAPHPHAEFLPPELRDVADYEVFDNSDLYSLAKMANFLFGAGFSPPVQTLLSRCLSDDPSDRPQDPTELLQALDALTQPAPVVAPIAEPIPAPIATPTAPDAPPVDYLPGEIIDGVNTVLGLLGRGAGAVVYRVANEPLGAELALKLMLRPPLGYDPKAELQLLRAVTSPHIPRVHWLGRVAQPSGASAPYLLLDLVEGERLSERLRRGPLPIDEALARADELLDALTALHAAGAEGALHRDVKPDNLVLGPAGLTLVDFSSAREVSQSGAAPEGSLRTTPPDLAETGWQPQADVFAAACVLFEMLTGEPPWPGAPAGEPPSARTLRRELSAPVQATLSRALAPRAADRFPSAIALRDALRDAQVVPPPPPPTQLSAVVEDASAALWTAARVRAMARHPDLAVPFADALLIHTDPSADPRGALLESEAQATALEAPLPEVMPRLYDALLLGLAPAALSAPDQGAPSAATQHAAPGDRALWFDALHFTEWRALLDAAAPYPHEVWVWAPRPGAAVQDAVIGVDAPPLRLPDGDRASVELGALMAHRRALITAALSEALSLGGPLWVGANEGLVYLGHGLRHDVGEALGDGADAARAAWAAAFPFGRAAPTRPAPPTRLRAPVRSQEGLMRPVGRLAWPDAPGTPWLQRGGLSLPERLSLLLRISP